MLHLIVNSFCFLTYTTLTGIILCNLRGVIHERRTIKIIAVYIIAFLCNPIEINCIVKSVTWLISLLYKSEYLRGLWGVDILIQLVISTFIFTFIFDMMSVRSVFESQDSTENLKRQISIRRMRYGFIITYLVVAFFIISIFFSVLVRGFKYKSF